jgi:hypothetical protein
VCLWRGIASDRAEGLTLAHSFWEQGVVPNDIVVLYPVAGLKQVTVKTALSAALFSGWLLKSAIKTTSGLTLRKTSTLRQSSKKPYFFVLRNSCLFSFKTDSRTERVHKVILLDYYRYSKVPMEGGKGFAIRLDQRENGFAPMTPVYMLHTLVEAEIDGWCKSIAMVQRAPAAVFGVSLFRVINRWANVHQYTPDILVALVDELSRRLAAESDRWKCLGVAGAKPPAELTKLVTSDRLPVLSGHADTACAAALRAYLEALPEPLLKPELALILDSAHKTNDFTLAASALASQELAVRTSLRRVLELLQLVPLDQLEGVCLLFGPSLVKNVTTEVPATLVWILSHAREVLNPGHATIDLSVLMRRSFKQRQAQLVQEYLEKEDERVKREAEETVVVDASVPVTVPERRPPPPHPPSSPNPQTPPQPHVDRLLARFAQFERSSYLALEEERTAKVALMEQLMILESHVKSEK